MFEAFNEAFFVENRERERRRGKLNNTILLVEYQEILP
jgi:hypothetical protein